MFHCYAKGTFERNSEFRFIIIKKLDYARHSSREDDDVVMAVVLNFTSRGEKEHKNFLAWSICVNSIKELKSVSERRVEVIIT